MADLRPAVPIVGAEPVTRGGVTFLVLPQLVRITVRGRDADPALTAAVSRVLGAAPPRAGRPAAPRPPPHAPRGGGGRPPPPPGGGGPGGGAPPGRTGRR